MKQTVVYFWVIIVFSWPSAFAIVSIFNDTMLIKKEAYVIDFI